jgi:hypothetical protein
MKEQNTTNDYLTKVIQRLRNEGFDCRENVTYSGQIFKYVAKRTRFELTKFGFSETFFVFAEFPLLDTSSLRKFSTKCYEYAKKTKSIPLPCGLFEYVLCFSVAITGGIDMVLAEAVRNETPTKHNASAEIPVVYDLKSNTLYYIEKTPLWGAVYYAGFRKTIQKLLAP